MYILYTIYLLLGDSTVLVNLSQDLWLDPKESDEPELL